MIETDVSTTTDRQTSRPAARSSRPRSARGSAASAGQSWIETYYSQKGQSLPSSSRRSAMRSAARPVPAPRTGTSHTRHAVHVVPRNPHPPFGFPISRLERSESRLATVACLVVGVTVTLLLIYLAAYAHLAQLGLHHADARVQLRQLRQENERLRAESAALQSPGYVSAAAAQQNMQMSDGKRVYIVPQASSEPLAAAASGIPTTASQGGERGTPQQDSTAAIGL